MAAFPVIEFGLAVLAVVLAFTVPRVGWSWFEAVERSFGKLAERRGLSVIAVGLTALTLRAALLPILPIPQPGVLDEFGYLLLSDTFAHGRLTNPTSPMWVHFESFYVLWKPTHTAMYYPAQGLILAFGQVVLGHPFWGVWLSVGLMCAAITWMLQGWLSPGWALLGGFLAVIRLGTFSYWVNSYYGGAVAAIGGALVLGALPRMKQQKRVHQALLMGLGFAILANSRPYEGLFFGIPVAVVLLAWLCKMKRAELGHALKRALAPLLAVLVLTLVAMGYYFWRTTGSPFNTPYLVYMHTYNPVPYFPWQSLKPIPAYHHPRLRSFLITHVTATYDASRTASGLVHRELREMLQFWGFYLGFVFTIPLLLVTLTLPHGYSWKEISSSTRFLLIVCGVVAVGTMLVIDFNPHYAAEVTCAILALVLLAMQRVRNWTWHGKPTGLFITRTIPSICLMLFALRAAAGVIHWPPVSTWPGEVPIPSWCSESPHNLARAEVLKKLRRYPGKQLVIVHYKPDHEISFHEWVYNRADLNTAKVIWADDMGPVKNEKLIRFFKHRHAWLVDADDNPPKLEPYPKEAGQQPLPVQEKGP